MKLHRTDAGAAGTLRWHRMMRREITQRQLAEACGLTQADIHNYEAAKVFLRRQRARQLAQGLFPKGAIGDPHGALLQTYALWLETVAVYGDAAMKARARKLREDLDTLGWRLPLQVLSDKAETPRPAADVCTLPDAPKRKERRA